MPDDGPPSRYIRCDACGAEIAPEDEIVIEGPLQKRIKAWFAGEGMPQVRYLHGRCEVGPDQNQTLEEFLTTSPAG